MNEDKIQTIKKTIESSEALTVTEKNEWLQLLPIMNDKQLNELVRILELGKPKENVKSVMGQPISHIANLPHTGVNNTTQNIPPLPPPVVKPKVEPVVPVSKSVVPPPPLAVEPPKPLPPKQEPVASVLKNVPRPTPVEAPSNPVIPVTGVINTERLQKNTPFVVPSFTAGPLQTPEIAQKRSVPVTPSAPSAPTVPHLESLNDLSVFTPAQFRLMDPKSFSETVINFVKQNEYFQVKFALEQSPLYKTYIAMGKAMLEGNLDFMAVQNEYKTSNKEYLTQLEFERLADLFASIQVN